MHIIIKMPSARSIIIERAMLDFWSRYWCSHCSLCPPEPPEPPEPGIGLSLGGLGLSALKFLDTCSLLRHDVLTSAAGNKRQKTGHAPMT